MRINRDFFDNPVIPDYVLCKANKERIGVLQCTDKTIDFKFNNLDEINFTIYYFMNGEENPFYNDVDVMKYIFVPDVGFFSITSINIQSEGTEFESKDVTAKSYECLLAQRYLENFVINMGTVESIDSVQFYNLSDASHSLLNLILEKAPEWKIGHIDPALMTMQRSFEIDRQDIYSFLMNDVAEAFGCFFLFDTLTNTINIYKEETVSKDTNIHISYTNLLKNTTLSYSTDDIKTCLTITGSDDLTVREINMGYDKIYNFDYYNSTEFMSRKLYEAYNKWIVLRNSQLPIYTSLLSQYQDFYTQINYLNHQKMPSVTGSTDWSEYGLQSLKEQLAAYEQQQAVSMKAGHGDPSNQFYESLYLPIYNTIQGINSQIQIVEQQINSLKDQQTSISNQMSEIIRITSMQNNFTKEELDELNSFIREEELNSSNYVVTDIMTDDERFEMLNSMLEFGEKELAKASVPQLSFEADIANLFAIPEFEKIYDDFVPGNYIWVTLRDDFSIKAKLLSVHVNFYDTTDFSVTFGNVVRKSKDRCYDIVEVLNKASNAATSVSFNASYWSQSAKDTSIIGQILDEGLIAAGKYLKNGDDSEMVIDTRGIFINTTSGEYAYKDSIFLGGGRILFTDDNWKTVAMSVGRADVTIKGVTQSRFGTFADFLIAGYIAGSVIEGTEIIGGTITGSRFNNGNGTFSVDENGVLSATKGNIGGAVISDNSIHSSDNNWLINSDGSTSFKNIVITDNATYGSTVANPFSGTTIPHIESLAANYIKVNYLDAINADIKNLYANEAQLGNLIATKATITDLNAATARIGALEADHVSVESLNAVNAKFNNLNASNIKSGTISADRIDVNTITSKLQQASLVQVVDLTATDGVHCKRLTLGTLTIGSTCHWGTIESNGTFYTVLCQ
ncbi:MAG: phage tail protein [bacterium]|nr:phage tail protein [bacterium]